MYVKLNKDVKYNPNNGGDLLRFKVSEESMSIDLPEKIAQHLVKYGYAEKANVSPTLARDENPGEVKKRRGRPPKEV